MSSSAKPPRNHYGAVPVDEQTRLLSTNTEDEFGHLPGTASSFNTIKNSVSALKPYLQKKISDKMQKVQILEVFANGERGYSASMTLNQLLQFIHERVVKVEEDAKESLKTTPSQESTSSSNSAESSSGTGSKSSGGGSEKHGRGLSTSSVRGSVGAGSSSGYSQKNMREIQYHDLRHLDHQFHIHEEPTVIVRRHAVLLSLNPLRAIVTADRIILIVPDGCDSLLYMLHDYMKGIIEDEVLTYGRIKGAKPTLEIRGYKAMFGTISAVHQQEYKNLCVRVDTTLTNLKLLQNITAEMQETLRVLKNNVLSQLFIVHTYQRVLRELLKNEEDLALMNLTVLKGNPAFYHKPLAPEVLVASDDTSALVEAYLMDYHAMGTKLEYLRAQIQNTEELVSFRLSTYRNELLFVDMTLIMVAVGLGTGSFFANMFGMNLNSGIETLNFDIFWVVFGVIVLLSIAIILILLFRYRLTGTTPEIKASLKKNQ